MSAHCTYRLASGGLVLSALCTLLPVLPAYAQGDPQRAVPPPGKALVFVFRVDREPITAQVPVVVNKELIGELANGTFVVATVSPGTTDLRIGQGQVSTFSFVAAADQSYFVRVEASDGRPLVGTTVHPVSEQDGLRSLENSRFVGVAPLAQMSGAAAKPAVTQPATARETPATRGSHRDGSAAFIAKAGTFKLSKENQAVAGVPSTFDTTSSSVFGFELEWRSKSGFAVGGEYFSYKNDLAPTGTTASGQQKVYVVLLNGKYYFQAADWIYPFVGAGIGQANTTYSGAFSGYTNGLAYQGMAGIEFRIRPVGIYVQYKYLSAKSGDSNNDVKVGGSGVLAGVSISF